ncbi:DUF262 domain-containing protein [Deinococcus altitudinis]|uniref:DUF262 domain-containing protein n=1 Tax=Deinococcus altitudinis TaxID=468914 RepID=UPI003891D9FC
MENASIENDKSWFFDDEPEDSGYSIKEYDITAAPNDFNIKSLYEFLDSGVIVIPSFQRNFVWDIRRASKLMESIIIGLPIPQIFLYEEAKNKFMVIDGQQRLMSIYYFVKQRFPRKEKRSELRRIFDSNGKIPEDIIHDDNYFTKFNLKLDEVGAPKSPFHNLNYETLDDTKFTFQMRTVRNIIVKQNLPDDDSSSIYELFNRLNTGGVNLRPQEIRASLYHSDFYNMLYKLNSNDDWRMILGMPEPDINMKDIEIILRGFAMLTDMDAYRSSMQKFLNSYSRKAKRINSDSIDLLNRIFLKFIEESKKLGNEPFSSQRGKFNISLYDAVFVAVCKSAYLEKDATLVDINMDSFNELKSDGDFNEATLYAAAGTGKILRRLEIAQSILEK